MEVEGGFGGLGGFFGIGYGGRVDWFCFGVFVF